MEKIEFKKMDLIPYTMPPFLRIQWASKKIKDKWEPKFNLAKNVFYTLEQETVIHEIRSVTTTHVSFDQMDMKNREFAQKGLYFLPLEKVANYSGFSNYHPKPKQNEPYNYYGVLANSIQAAEDFAHYTNNGDHTGLGKLLGYPKCCTNFFNDVWRDQKYHDPQWQKLENTNSNFIKKNDGNFVRLKEETPWEINSFLRNFSVGPIFHTTCSHDCTETLKIARTWLELGKKLNVAGMEEMEQFLRMPMEWDSWKGIVYLRTPLFKASYNGCMSKEKFIIQREGTFYPEDAPKALEFPWNEYYKIKSKVGVK